MRVHKIILERKLTIPLAMVLVASAIGTAAVASRILWTGRWIGLYLPWNLFLAWLPLCFALFACSHEKLGKVRSWRFMAHAGAWLIFFPNAPYIFTDLIHLTTRHRHTFWIDLVLILLFALTGLLLAFLSLFLMQTLVARRLNRVCGWLLVGAAAGLGSLGIYIGRFLRWNSWDILLNPVDLFQDLTRCASLVMNDRHRAVFPTLLTVFLFLAYAMLYALTHLDPVAPAKKFGDSRCNL
ncbi:MAG: DUF1361 domain-containing protein [Verrucomicrobiales bacterium]|nr:DUF1361 domain-containing protein [Verrucomicrobiales bacterium]